MEFIDLKSQYRALKTDIDARIQAVLNHGQYIMGPEVAELEARLATLTGAKHCVSVASGTEALIIALMALDIGPGHEVITTPFTFAATAEAILLVGAKPVYVDILPGSCNIDPALIEAAITPASRAIMPVSLYGQIADMDEINAIGARHGLTVIEDAAQSFGARYKGRRSCNTSTIGATSFFPSKPLGCYGDGGALFTSDDVLAKAFREIRVHGQSQRYLHTRLGLGGRMDTLQCAVVLGKLERFDWEIEQRKRLGVRYAELIQASGAPVELLAVADDRDCVWAQYTIKISAREAVQASLKAAGIPTAVHYPRPLHQQPAYAHDDRPVDSLPLSNLAAQRVMSLPMSADMSDDEQRQVVQALVAALAQA
jgi:UDP-2-acetamido-2-deoxy-ribo-hexuluronate aminotransferase